MTNDEAAIRDAADRLEQEAKPSNETAFNLATEREFLYRAKGEGRGPQFWNEVSNLLWRRMQNR